MLSQNSLGGALSEIKGFPLFAGLSDDLILNLCANSEIKVHQHKEQVFTFGESASYFGIVLSGAYKLSRIAISGEESVIRVMSEWVKKGYIVTTDQHIKILKPDLLIAQVDE